MKKFSRTLALALFFLLGTKAFAGNVALSLSLCFYGPSSIATAGFQNSYAFQGDGSTKYFDAGNTLHQSSNAQARTFVWWMKVTDYADYRVVFDEQGASGLGWAIYVEPSDGLLVVQLRGGAGNSILLKSQSEVYSGMWGCFAVSYDGSSSAAGTHVYRSGVSWPMTTSADTLTNPAVSTDHFTVGAAPGGGANFYGKLDEIGIYTSALSSSEIAAICGTRRPINLASRSSYSNNQAYWRFGDGPLDTSSVVKNLKNPGTFDLSGVNLVSADFESSDLPALSVPTIIWNGTTTTGDLGSNFNWEYTQPWTISMWVNPSYQPHGGTGPAEARQFLIGNTDNIWLNGPDAPATTFLGWTIALLDNADDTNLCPCINLANDYTNHMVLQCYRDQSQATVALNTWTHVVVSNSGSGTLAGIKTYLNGVLVTVTPTYSQDNLGGQTIVSDKTTSLGDDTWAYFYNPPEHTGPEKYLFKGSWRNIDIWDHALSDDNIAALYSNGRLANNRVIGTGGAPLASYFVNSPDFRDETGNGHDGTLSNATLVWEAAP